MTGSPVLDHLTLTVSDAAASRRFFAAALAPLGFGVLHETADGAVGFGCEGFDDFYIAPAGPEPVSTGVHVAFRAADRAAVDAFYAAAMAAGGRDRDGAPRVRPEYSTGYYAAFVTDPDGNNVEAVVHEEVAP